MDGSVEEDVKLNSRRELKSFYLEFFKDFREFLAEYIRESVYELTISELPVEGSLRLFDGLTQGKVTLKNQGSEPCYITTLKMGGYRLDPGERCKFFVNAPVTITTEPDRKTTIGFIKS